MKCNCPHCGHENIANTGQLRRCDSCRKGYAHETQNLNNETNSATTAIQDTPQKKRKKRQTSHKKRRIPGVAVVCVVMVFLSAAVYYAQDELITAYNKFVTLFSNDNNTPVARYNSDNTRQDTIEQIRTYTKVNTFNEQDFLVLMAVMRVEGDHCKKTFLTSSGSQCIASYMKYFDANSNFIRGQTIVDSLFHAQKTPYSHFDAEIHLRLKKDNDALYNFFREIEKNPPPELTSYSNVKPKKI